MKARPEPQESRFLELAAEIMKPSEVVGATPEHSCAQCGEAIHIDPWSVPRGGSDEYAETARGLVHASCMAEGEEIA